MKKQSVNMLSGPLLRNVIRYTVPIILTSLLQLLFNAADMVVLGQFCGSVSVGAVGATTSLIHLIVNLFIGLSLGAGVVVAHALGSGQEQEVSTAVHTAMPLSAVSGAILTVIGLLVAPGLLRWMETPAEYLSLSTQYVQIYFAGMVPQMVYGFGAAVLRAAGDTKRPLYYLTAAGVMNVVLNIFFVTVFHMDVAGVALATTLSQTLSAVLVVWAMCRREDACRFSWHRMTFAKVPMLRMLRIGVPAGIQNCLFSVSNVLIQSTVNSLGPAVVTGFAAGANIEGFVYAPMNGFQQTTLNFVGQNVGAGQYERVRRVTRTCLACVTVVGAVLGALAYGFAQPLLRLYITDSAEAITFGVTRIAWVCLPYLLCGAMEVVGGAIRGMGVSLLPTATTVLAVCVFRMLWVWFAYPVVGTADFLLSCYPISWILNLAAQFGIYAWLIRRRRQLAVQHDEE